jgi:hypothetical protein
MWELFDFVLGLLQLIFDILNSRNGERNGNYSHIQTLFPKSG